MNYFIVSAGFFISAATLYSARYITSALLATILNGYGSSIVTSQTLSLFVLSLVALILAILFLLLGLHKERKQLKKR